MVIPKNEQQWLIEKIKLHETAAIERLNHIILTGPSGSGKTTILKGVRNKLPACYDISVSATTRPRRKTEQQGIDYDFVGQEQFKKIPMLEHNPYSGNGKYYGTKCSEIERICIKGSKRSLFDVDINGGMRLKEIFKSSIYFFFLQVPLDVLYRRLEKRMIETGETYEDIDTRIKAAEHEQQRVLIGDVVPDFVLPYDDMVTIDDAVNRILALSDCAVYRF